MNRYVHGSFFFLFLFFNISLVFCQLSQNQTDIITRLAFQFRISPWNTSRSNPCSWRGVGCSGNSITNLSLSGFGISSNDFLVGLCQIDSLQSLDLSNNSLSTIPPRFIDDCGMISGLRMLNFSVNMLGGFLPAFTGFAGLQFLDLSFNLFSGNVTLQLDRLAQLRSLNLSSNRFNGFVPTNLGRGMVLGELQLSKNQFQGPIPEELTSYANLTFLDLSENRITGSIPAQVGALSKLEILLLSSNNLTGEIPQNLLNITTLTRFAANQNHFMGSIPRGISSNLRSLDLSYNFLSGAIPSDLLQAPSLRIIDLTSNSLEGAIPTNISSNLFRLRLSFNSLNGTIPPTVGQLTHLAYLEMEGNRLSGEIPSELVKCPNLALLNLGQNHLQGQLPKELTELHQLQVLKLDRNNFRGEIPLEISQLRRLFTLNMSQNSLTGTIPEGISSLSELLSLHLGDNELTGSIPEGIADLRVLLELQLGRNRLSGQIPRMPLGLQIALNLSYNIFNGSIPGTFDRLQTLEVLDLSNNGFTGQVPAFLSGLVSLTQLDISNNQLSGALPSFRSGLILKYAGNRNLHAAPPPSPGSVPASISQRRRIPTIVVIVVTIASAILVVGVVAVILKLVSRRFYRVDDENLQPGEHPGDVIDGHLITANSLHRSRIDFTRAMEAVKNPANVILKSRFSTFYKATMPCGMSYCVKKLNCSDKIFESGSQERFGQVLELLGRLSNSKIMTPLAYAFSADTAYMFYEYVHKGTVFDFLHGSTGDALDWPRRYTIALGVAQGLAFLHGCTDAILLLHLSTKTILLKSWNEPQIADIELCQVIDPSKSIGGLSYLAGSVGYIHPEYAYTMRVTMAGNVYSYGVVLLELLTGKPPVSDGTELAKWVVSHSAQKDSLEQILDPSVSKTSPAVCSQMLSVLKVAQACVSISPEARPQMKNVVRMLLNAK